MEAEALSRRLAEGPAEGITMPMHRITSSPRGRTGRVVDGSKSSA
jgi:hypothetical protein